MFNINKSACVLAAAFFVSLTTWGNAFAEGEGCTPGFWKQEHHFYDWGYTSPAGSTFSNMQIDADGDYYIARNDMKFNYYGTFDYKYVYGFKRGSQ